MDLQSFLQSGLLESYVLGQCSPAERQLVEAMLTQHEAARSELADIERSLEALARAQAIEPPAQLKQQILERIDQEAAPGGPAPPEPLSKPGVGALRWFQLLALALLAAAGYCFFLLQNLQKRHETLEKTALATQLEWQRCQERAQADRAILALLRDPATRAIALKDAGQNRMPQPGYVFQNNIRCQVLLDVASLPPPPPGKYLQFWALADGPQSMGMVDPAATDGLQVFACVEGAKGFAVSIEDKPGGSATPTTVLALGG
jgi:anti-sigma-K factor RskA